MFMDPGHINIARRRHPQWCILPSSENWHRSLIPPSMDFRMAVSEGKAGGAVVVAGWEINDDILGRLGRPARSDGCAVHAHREPTVVNAGVPLIENDPNTGWR